MPIDTEIPGDPESVEETAGWLKKVKDAFNSIGQDMTTAVETSHSGFEGETGDAYRMWASIVRETHDDIYFKVRDSEEEFRTYAVKLRAKQTDMENARSRATREDLTLTGFIIQPPPAAEGYEGYNPFNDERTFEEFNAERRAHRAAVRKIRVYEEIQEDVVREQEELDTYIAGHLADVEADVESLGEGLIGLVAQASSIVDGTTINAAAVFDEFSNSAYERAGEARTEWDNRHGAREDYGGRRHARHQSDGDFWADRAAGVREGAKVLPLVDWPINAWEIHSGDNDSTAVVEIGVGIVTAPLGPVAWVLGPFVGPAYEHVVPGHWRARADEVIDDVADEVGQWWGNAWRRRKGVGGAPVEAPE